MHRHDCARHVCRYIAGSRLAAASGLTVEGMSKVSMIGLGLVNKIFKNAGADRRELARRISRLEARGVFDGGLYLECNPDVARAGLAPLAHYLENGFVEGRDPHPLFRQTWYAARRARPGDGRCSWLEDYVFEAAAASVAPHPLFDPSWYAQQVPDRDTAALAPLEHYLLKGWREGLSPNPYFDPDWYLRHTDARESGLEPLTHYVLRGEADGAAPSQHFDPHAYLDAYPDVARCGLSPLEHFLHTGADEGREPRPTYSTRSAHHLNQDRERLRTAVAYDPGAQPSWTPGTAPARAGRHTILLTAHSAGERLYGAERSFLDVLDALAALDVNVIATLPKADNADYLASVAQRCSGVYVLPTPQWRDGRDSVERLILLYRRIIADQGVDLVCANTIVQLEPLIAARRSGCVSVVHARELITLDAELAAEIGSSPAEIISSVFGRTDYVLANSDATLSAFYRPGRTFLAPNVVDAEKFAPPAAPSKPMRFGIVGSNLPKKGLNELASLARRLGEEAAGDIELVVIGPDRASLDPLREQIRSGNLPDIVRFAGYASSPQDAMAKLDVLLNLSEFAESFGRTIAEAAAAGKPAIAYHWGALSELIEDGETGYLVGYRDIETVAEQVRCLAADADRVARMGQRARECVIERFSPGELTASLRSALGDMLARRPPASGRGDRDEPPVIVLTVHNAFEALDECLHSIFRNTDPDMLRMIIVDDASSDDRVASRLAELAPDSRIHLIRNTENQGYTRSANLGVRAANGRDVVLLNSDVTVTPAWLEGLRAPVWNDPTIGTVTAMSDNAGAFSFPDKDCRHDVPDGLDRDIFARMMVQATGACDPVETPTGSGFCMLIRGALIEQIGLFDEGAFPRGYGEENDFCMRAVAAGWRNVITPWSYVYHRRNASFGAEKAQLLEAGVAEVIRRHPAYVDAVDAAFRAPGMAQLRAAARKAHN